MFQSPSKESVCACETLPAILRFGIVLSRVVLLFDGLDSGISFEHNSLIIIVLSSRLADCNFSIWSTSRRCRAASCTTVEQVLS